MKRRLRMGMVGGVAVRSSARCIGWPLRSMERSSSRVARSARTLNARVRPGADLLLPEHRVYGDYHEMIEREAALPADEKMDFVAVVTPNDQHHGPAKLALEAGFPVMCDKPLCLNMEQAKELEATVEKNRSPVRPHPQLHRLPDGQRGARAGARR